MKHVRGIKVFLQLCMVAGMLAVLSNAAFGKVPQLISYQGYLTDSLGNPINGDYQMVFSIYDVPTAGSALWWEEQTVLVINGIYNVQIGQDSIGNPFPDNLFEGQRWLGVTVETNVEMTPRQLLTCTPFAMRAEVAEKVADGTVDTAHIVDSAVTTDKVEDNAITSAKIDDGTVTAGDLQDGAVMAEILDNDGVGSELDADLLDGMDSGDFMTAWTDNWVDETGDTMTSNTNESVLYVTNTGGGTAVRGYAVGDAGRGIDGYASGNNGTSGFFTASGLFGTAVYGNASNTGDASNYGGKFSAYGRQGVGVRGLAIGESGTGVTGESSGSSGEGGYFIATGSRGKGVHGYASNTANDTNYGGYFTASGASGRGVYGSASGADGRGIYGHASGTSGWGVYGESLSSDGVHGKHSSSQVTGYGVHGESAAGAGVYGNHIGFGPTIGYGVYGETKSGEGVYGKHTGSGNYGALGGLQNAVYGNSSGGYAGYFEGKAKVTQDLTIDGKVGIGTTTPELSLHVVGPNGGTAVETMKIDSDGESDDIPLRIRSKTTGSQTVTDADTKFIVMGDGNVGIGTTSPSAKLDVNGDAYVEGKLTWKDQTSYYTVPAAAFHPNWGSFDYQTTGASVYGRALIGHSPADLFCAPVYLPHLAKVIKVTFYWYDGMINDNGSVTLKRYPVNGDVGNNMVSLITRLVGTGNTSSTSISYADINNQQYAYYLWAYLPNDQDGALQLYSVAIEYTNSRPH